MLLARRLVALRERVSLRQVEPAEHARIGEHH